MTIRAIVGQGEGAGHPTRPLPCSGDGFSSTGRDRTTACGADVTESLQSAVASAASPFYPRKSLRRESLVHLALVPQNWSSPSRSPRIFKYNGDLVAVRDMCPWSGLNHDWQHVGAPRLLADIVINTQLHRGGHVPVGDHVAALADTLGSNSAPCT